MKSSHFKKIFCILISIFSTSGFADASIHSVKQTQQKIQLNDQHGFFRFSFDNVKMPQSIQHMGLLGVNYYADITPLFYGGAGGFGSVTGSQGGLFVLSIGGGLHHELVSHIWGDVGLDAGGGGGRSSLVGGGLMLRPHVGFYYQWQALHLGVHYSVINFPYGKIRSQQIGVDLDIPTDFYYTAFQNGNSFLSSFDLLQLPAGDYLDFQKNDFALLLQNYYQQKGTRNLNGAVQDGTISLVGAELDHYLTDKTFWSLQTSGAFHGIPNGYMDVFGGLGYHAEINSYGIAIVPQFALGAGGGGNVDTGGGFLVHPVLGIELPLTSQFSARLSGGYLWAPRGKLKAVTVTGEILEHLNFAKATSLPTFNLKGHGEIQNWNVQIFNQTYFHPLRTDGITSPIQLLAVQIDQFFTPNFFFAYQAASAYHGEHSGGYATGMIGPGIKSKNFLNEHLNVFGEVLVGAAGGGGLAVNGGSLVEPVVGLYYGLTPAIGLQTSVGQLKALRSSLNTTVFNFGLQIQFGAPLKF